jgi:hypothetical protein
MQIRNRAFLGFFAASLLPVLALSCSGDDDSGDATATATQPSLTRVVESETTPALQSAEGATPTATAEPPTAVPPTATPEVIVVQPADAEPPSTTASAGGTTVDMGIGSYCWSNACVDKIGPVTRGTLTIMSGDQVSVAFPDGAPALNSVSVSAYMAGQSTDLGGGQTAWAPPLEESETLAYASEGSDLKIDASLDPGTYVLMVGMFFESGDVQYAVVLEVQ